jgi:predicted TIM-barrel enzyme/DNA-binding NtrC family response regulator
MDKNPTSQPKRELPALLARGRFLLGAAIGTGMAAKAAEHGGADFLLALNAGRFRSMGTPSAACMLALRDCNRMVMDFGQVEILTQTSLPVFFGAAAFGTADSAELVRQIANAGFHGVANFPSCVFLDGQFRQFLEETGYGFDRELALLQIARDYGLATLAYVHTVEEASRAAAHADIVNLDFGWNMGGSVGVESSLDLDDSSMLATEFVSAVHAINPRTRCVIEGGPIVTAEQMDRVCRSAKADGYIGGSTIDRVPLESAIEMATSAFKTIGGLRKQVDSLEKRLTGKAPVEALTGFSETMERVREQVARAMEIDSPVLIVGEAGTGRRDLAKVIHEARAPRGRWLVSAECRDGLAADMELNLLGCAVSDLPGVKSRVGLLEVARGSTLVLDDVASLDIAVQRQLLQAVQTGGFWPRGGTDIIPLDVRFIGISSLDLATESDTRRCDARFMQWLGAIRIEVPPLREHLEDLPMLAETILRTLPRGKETRLSPSAYRVLLGYHWPGNVAELRTVLRAATSKRGSIIADGNIASLLTSCRAVSNQRSFLTEREWILDGLKRNRYRRAETAQFLRLSRKTLYNKIRQYGIMGRRGKPHAAAGGG